MTLREQIAAKNVIIEAYEIGIVELNRYINSSKFSIDTTVQVGDIALRINELNSEIVRLEHA